MKCKKCGRVVKNSFFFYFLKEKNCMGVNLNKCYKDEDMHRGTKHFRASNGNAARMYLHYQCGLKGYNNVKITGCGHWKFKGECRNKTPHNWSIPYSDESARERYGGGSNRFKAAEINCKQKGYYGANPHKWSDKGHWTFSHKCENPSFKGWKSVGCKSPGVKEWVNGVSAVGSWGKSGRWLLNKHIPPVGGKWGANQKVVRRRSIKQHDTRTGAGMNVYLEIDNDASCNPTRSGNWDKHGCVGPNERKYEARVDAKGYSWGVAARHFAAHSIQAVGQPWGPGILKYKEGNKTPTKAYVKVHVTDASCNPTLSEPWRDIKCESWNKRRYEARVDTKGYSWGVAARHYADKLGNKWGNKEILYKRGWKDHAGSWVRMDLEDRGHCAPRKIGDWGVDSRNCIDVGVQRWSVKIDDRGRHDWDGAANEFIRMHNLRPGYKWKGGTVVKVFKHRNNGMWVIMDVDNQKTCFPSLKGEHHGTCTAPTQGKRVVGVLAKGSWSKSADWLRANNLKNGSKYGGGTITSTINRKGHNVKTGVGMNIDVHVKNYNRCEPKLGSWKKGKCADPSVRQWVAGVDAKGLPQNQWTAAGNWLVNNKIKTVGSKWNGHQKIVRKITHTKHDTRTNAGQNVYLQLDNDKECTPKLVKEHHGKCYEPMKGDRVVGVDAKGMDANKAADWLIANKLKIGSNFGGGRITSTQKHGSHNVRTGVGMNIEVRLDNYNKCEPKFVKDHHGTCTRPNEGKRVVGVDAKGMNAHKAADWLIANKLKSGTGWGKGIVNSTEKRPGHNAHTLMGMNIDVDVKNYNRCVPTKIGNYSRDRFAGCPELGKGRKSVQIDDKGMGWEKACEWWNTNKVPVKGKPFEGGNVADKKCIKNNGIYSVVDLDGDEKCLPKWDAPVKGCDSEGQTMSVQKCIKWPKIGKDLIAHANVCKDASNKPKDIVGWIKCGVGSSPGGHAKGDGAILCSPMSKSADSFGCADVENCFAINSVELDSENCPHINNLFGLIPTWLMEHMTMENIVMAVTLLVLLSLCSSSASCGMIVL
jgi:hypothetical protein